MVIPQNFSNQLTERIQDKQTAEIADALVTMAGDSDVRREIPGIEDILRNFISVIRENRTADQEYALMSLYASLHSAGSRYSPSERALLRSRGGYGSYAGGLSPITRAGPFLGKETVAADLGAGNGLQGLLFQRLYPHRKTILVELSGEMIRIGRILQKALGVDEDRVAWIHDEIANVSLEGVDFIYLYRPAHALNDGRSVYRNIAEKLISASRPSVVFSIADCLAEHLRGHFSVCYSDGHLTCFLRRDDTEVS